MTRKTWFLPPDFTFLPDGELALGTVIPYPDRPTFSLASINPSSSPEISLPGVNTFLETEHSHTIGSSKSFGVQLFARFIELASASGSVGLSRHKNKSLGNVNLELRTFANNIGADTLRSITALDRVSKYINCGLFSKRPVYIISGLRVTREPFQVTNEVGSARSISVEASGPVPAGALPLEIGGGISVAGEQSRTDSYKTAPGVVYAYRLHVIRVKRGGDVETELFSHRTAFLTGDGDDEEEAEEMECVEVTASVARDDMEARLEFDEYSLQEGEESFIVFRKSA